MIVLAVENFMAAINPYENQSFTKNDHLEVKRPTGYGMACSGDGMVGAYKLEMKFGQATSFVTKIELGCHDRFLAAGLMDFFLKYHFQPVTQ